MKESKMAKLSRLTLGNIENLISLAEVSEVGKGSIKEDRAGMIMETPNEKRTFKNSPTPSDRDKFLAEVDSLLRRSGMYLADISYKPSIFFASEKIRGTFYVNGNEPSE